MFWKNLNIELIGGVIFLILELIISLIRKSLFLTAPFVRLWKDTTFLSGTLRDQRFTKWKSRATRYVALRAIKAQAANQETPQPVLDLLESYLLSSTPVILLGEPGAGKTTALEALTYRLARRAFRYNLLIWFGLLIIASMLFYFEPVFVIIWLASVFLWESFTHRMTIPLFLEARSDYAGGKVEEWCAKILQDRLGKKPFFDSHHRIAFLVDGVNEVTSNLYDTFVEGWRSVLKNHSLSRVIFTSRAGENPSPQLELSNALNICDLDDAGVEEFLKIYGRSKAKLEKKSYASEQTKRDFAELQGKNLLGEKGIGRNPYWLKMIVESGLYTRNRGVLFHNFTKRLIDREIEEKPRKRMRKPDWKIVPLEVEMEALANMAIAMHQEKRIGFSGKPEWDKACVAIANSLGNSSYTPDDVLGEAEAATLVRTRYKRRVEFVHQLLQEFFVAYALCSDAKWRDALPHCEDVWWWQTLFLLGGLLGADGPSENYSFILQEVLGDGSNDQRLFATIGLLGSVENPSVELANKVMTTFTASINEKLTPNQISTAKELGRILGDQAVEMFDNLFQNPDFSIKTKGIALLCAIGRKRANEIIFTSLRDENEYRKMLSILVSQGALAVEPLIEALRMSDSALGFRAQRALLKIGIAAIPRLINALLDSTAFVRIVAADILGKIGDPIATEPLIKALHDKERLVRAEAATALGQIGDTRAVEPLITALLDPINKVNESSAKIPSNILDLVKIIIPALIRFPISLFKACVYMVLIEIVKRYDVNFAKKLKDDIITTVKHEYLSVSAEVAKALGKIRDQRAIESLIVALQDYDDALRSQAAVALGEIGDVRAVKPLINALRAFQIRLPNKIVKILSKIIGFDEIRSIENFITMFCDPNLKGGWECSLKAISRSVMRKSAIEEADSGVIDALAKIGVPAIPQLIAALSDQDENTRSRARRALDGIRKTPQVIERLIAALHHHAKDVRRIVVSLLDDFTYDIHDVESIITVLHDPEPEVRQAAANALGSPFCWEFNDRQNCRPRQLQTQNQSFQIVYNKIVESLIMLLNDPEENVRVAAVNALGQIADSQAVEPLLVALNSSNEEIRTHAAEALGEIGDCCTVESLIVLLSDPSKNVRRYVVDALGKIADPKAVEPLIIALRNSSESLRANAASALGQIGDSRAVEPLIKALQEKNEMVRAHAATALGEFTDSHTVDSLIIALRDPSAWVRKDVAEALGKIADSRAVESLIKVLSDKSKIVRENTAFALGRIADPRAIDPLIVALCDQEWVNKVAADALAKIGAQAVPQLIDALQDTNRNKREWAAFALGEIGAPLAAMSLTAALHDSDIKVSEAAAYALGKIGDQRATESLISLLRDPYREVCQAAAYALHKICDYNAIALLITALHDPDAEMRYCVAKILGEIGDEKVLPVLECSVQQDKSRSIWSQRSIADAAQEAAEKIRQRMESTKDNQQVEQE